MGGNQHLFGPLAKKYLSNNEWTDMYPSWDEFAKELEAFLGMLEVENRLDLYLPKLKTKWKKRDEALAELRVAYFFKRSGYSIVEWEPAGNIVNKNTKRGEFTLRRDGESAFFVEVKSPGWESELSPREIDAGRAKQPKFIPGQVGGGAVSPNKTIHMSIDKAYEKFLDTCPNLLVVADDLHFPLQFGGECFAQIALYDKSGGYGAQGYFTSKKYERLGGVAILDYAYLHTYYFRVYENPYALDACRLPASVLALKEGDE